MEACMRSGPLDVFQALNDPKRVTIIVWCVIVSYYIASYIFIHKNSKPDYKGWWRKNGSVDRGTSVLWSVTTVFLILSLFDLVNRNELPLRYLIHYFFLFILLFAFIYNICHWHWDGTLENAGSGWAAEVNCVIMSIGAMTTSGFMSTRPKSVLAELIASAESLLGLFFIAVFVAKAVSLVPAGG
jgi:hypothetical protein